MADAVPRERFPNSGPSGHELLWSAVRTAVQAQRGGLPLGRVSRERPLPASFAQRRLWFLERLCPGSAMHNQTVAYRLKGSLVPQALEAGLAAIVRRHEALRTTLRWSDDELIQEIHPPPQVVLSVEDVRAVAADPRMERVEASTRQEACAPFDIGRPPLLRARLFRLADDEHRLVVTMHHIAFDGWSFDVFMRELCALYAAQIAGVPAPLPELDVQYADHAAWQRARLQGGTLQRLVDYWKRQMGGAIPVLRMPTDRPRRSRLLRPGACRTFTLPHATTESLQRLASAEGATLYMALLAAFQTLLHRYTGEEDIVVGSPVASRQHAGVRDLIGLFVNTLPMRARVCGEQTFRQVLACVRKTVLDAYEHQDLPFDLLVDAVSAAPRTETTPLFQVMFAFQNLPRSNWVLPGLTVDAWNVGNGAAKFDLTLFMWDAPEGIGGLLEYDAQLFDGATAEQWLRHFRVLLDAIARDPGQRIANLPLLDGEERRQLLAAGNDTRTDYPRGQSIPQVFAARVRENPDAVALAFEDGMMSYAELDRQSRRLGRELRRRGVMRGTRVGVCLERSPALVVTLLAILKAGGAFVPVDPAWPGERIGMMLETTEVVVTDDASDPGVPVRGREVLNLDRGAESGGREGEDALAPSIGADDLAYIMFTSGSTGVPKGVCVPHRGVVRLVKGANYADLTDADVFLQLAPVTFDASTFEIWGALLNGATLALAPAGQPSVRAIGEAIRRYRVSILWLSSGLFEVMVDAGVTELATVRQLLVGGDVLSPSHAERFRREMPGCRLVNCYGPTENTTFTTFHHVQTPACPPGGSIPIGQPVSNSRVYVLDGAREPVPPGVAGEAYAGGDGLMRGYLGDPAATRECLVPDPFADVPDAWLYRTGDVVRRRSDGNLEFLGRRDEQIKIGGFRVEPGEVEAVLGRCSAVRRAAVVAETDPMHGRRLVAFVVPAAPGNAPKENLRAIRDFLSQRLPGYLMPSAFVFVAAIPLGPNGKVDRRRLRAAGEGARPREDAFVAPRDANERRIVEAFEHVLGRRPIGVDDDFFDLGGSSLSALRLVATLESAFAASLPLVSVYEHPTSARLAALVAQANVRRSRAARERELGTMLVEVKRGSFSLPLFLVPGGHGGMAEMTLYAKVLSHVRRDQPVYGLLACGADGSGQSHASVAQMADAYVAELRRVQPDGPYALAGECVGGLIAFEMAQQLRLRRQPVAVLLLLDTWCPTLAGVLHYRYIERPATLLAARRAVARRGMAEVGQVLRDHVRDRPPFGPLRSLRYAANVARTLARVGQPWVGAVNAVGKPAPGAERIAAAEANYVERTMRYRPRPYPGPITLIVSARNDRLGLARAWRTLAGGGLVVRTVPGDHDSYLRDTPELAAAMLEDALDATLGTGVPYGSKSPPRGRA